MITDEKFISYAKVTIYSVCKNTSEDNKLIFTILCDESLGTDPRKRLASLEEMFPNLNIYFYEVDTKKFVQAKPYFHIPVVAYYRLVCADVLDADKAIYLDSDLVVELDIAELYEIDIDDYYVAGVIDIGMVKHPNYALWHSENYNMKNYSDYINSGVLLMNLALMRKDNIVELFLKELGEKNAWIDQDIINRICTGKIRLVDWKFNYQTGYSDEDYEWNYKYSERSGGREIIHYAGSEKPWGNRFVRMADVWWGDAKEALETDEYEKLYRKVFIGFGSEEIAGIAEACLKEETVIIVGYSDYGIEVKNALRKHGVTANIMFCDNSSKKRGLLIANTKVYSPEELADKYKDSIWINAVQKGRSQIMEQLRELGIPQKQIIIYFLEQDIEK